VPPGECYTPHAIIRPRLASGTALRLRAARGALPSGGLLFVYDLTATALSVVLSLLLRFETLDWSAAVAPFLPVALIPLIVRPPIRVAFGLYQREWRFASIAELRDIAAATIVGSVLIVALYGLAAALNLPGAHPFPRSFFFVEPLITLCLVGGMRFALRIRIEGGLLAHEAGTTLTPTLIFGAGEAGAAIARTAQHDHQMGIKVVGFLDDDQRKHGSRLLGLRVFGPLADLGDAVNRTRAVQLLIAMPSRSGSTIRRAADAGRRAGLQVKTIPPIVDLVTGAIQLAAPRSISVEDLLRREPVQLDTEAIAQYLNGASVLVTGGGGSIGAELVRQMLRVGPRVLTVVDHHEAALWNVELEAKRILGLVSGVRINPVLADVRSAASMKQVIGRARPDVVFHAAALKHVPYVEFHPSEGVVTNVLGTRNTLDACRAAGVQRFVLISTDKAVEPSSVMGWTKRVAELLTIAAGRREAAAYSVVRFGNVLGSSGSLVPLVERQIQDGVPITLTEPDATRYFMTLSEAVALILEAGATAGPGQLYVLDMGEPVRIGDLVRDIVRLHGLDDLDVPVTVTGLRPGEKLHESLYFPSERLAETGHPGIRRAVVSSTTSDSTVHELVRALGDAALAADDDAVRALLRAHAAENAELAASQPRNAAETVVAHGSTDG
jgi:FlaA1/EpsC-like NDP-sugar epimerase